MADVVNLGGREYTLVRLQLRQASAIRKKIEAEAELITGLAQRASGIELRDTQQVGAVLEGLRQLLFNSIEILFDLLCEYSPQIKADREWLLDHAYDEEVIEAALVMVKQLFPFGKAGRMLSGLAENMTSTSSPSTTVSTVTKPS